MLRSYELRSYGSKKEKKKKGREFFWGSFDPPRQEFLATPLGVGGVERERKGKLLIKNVGVLGGFLPKNVWGVLQKIMVDNGNTVYDNYIPVKPVLEMTCTPQKVALRGSLAGFAEQMSCPTRCRVVRRSTSSQNMHRLKIYL